MKKIIRLITLLLCVCLLSVCFSGCEKDLEGKIEISGDKITLEEVNSIIEQRKTDYPQDEEGAVKEEWFNIEISLITITDMPEPESASINGDVTNNEILLSGKVGFLDEDKMALDLQINADIDVVVFEESKVKKDEKYTLSGKLILLDEVYYLDFIKTTVEEGAEKSENIKKTGGKEVLDEFAGLEEMKMLLVDLNSECNFDSINLEMLDIPNLDLGDEESAVAFYKTEDKIFAESKNNLFVLGNGFKYIMQHEYEFEKDSSLIKTKRVYTRLYAKMGIGGVKMKVDVEISFNMQRIAPAVIVAPDLEGYEQA